MKIYRNERFGFSFKYPEMWAPQEVPGWSPPGAAIDFYPNGVTPDPGEADRPTNAGLRVVIQSGTQQTNEQFVSAAPKTAVVLNVAGKPTIKGDWYYSIKLSSTRELVLAMYNKDGAKGLLDAIISTIKFTNK